MSQFSVTVRPRVDKPAEKPSDPVAMSCIIKSAPVALSCVITDGAPVAMSCVVNGPLALACAPGSSFD